MRYLAIGILLIFSMLVVLAMFALVVIAIAMINETFRQINEEKKK
jgi:hypothetical protein